MTKWIVQDYFSKFRFKSIVVKKQQGAVIGWILFVLGIPVFMLEKTQERILLYFLLLGPIAFANLNERIHPEICPKIFYLCPMNKEERKKYIQKTFQFRMWIPVLLGIPGTVFAFAAGYYDVAYVIGVLFQLVAVSYICADYLGRISQAVGVILAWICMLFYYNSIFWGTSEVWWIKRILFLTALLIEIPILLYCRKRRLERIEAICSYEGGELCSLQFSLKELWRYMNKL